MTTRTRTQKPVTNAELDAALTALRGVRWIANRGVGRAVTLSPVEAQQINGGISDGIKLLERVRRGDGIEG